jgi:hypothetical protein
MNVNHYIGFDVHKKSVSYCVKLIFYTMMAEVIHFQRVAILKTA